MPKLVKVAKRPNSHLYTNTSTVTFALVSKPDHGFRVVTGINTCRDYISDAMRAAANRRSDGAAGYSPSDKHDVDFDTLRLLVHSKRVDSDTNKMLDKAHFEKRLYRAVNIINRFEERAGFNSRSRIEPVIFDGQKDMAWMITGPGEWMRASQAVSMITLIIRVCVYSGGKEEVPRFVKTGRIVQWFGKIIKENAHKAKGYTLHSDIRTYLPNSYEKFELMMDYFDDIFPPNSQKELLPSAHSCWHSCGGISTMWAKGGTQVPLIDNTAQALWKKHGKSKKAK